MTVRSKGTHTPEAIKQLLKAKIKPSEIKVGINTFKTLNSGKVLIETNSKEEIEALEKDIQANCGGDLEINNHTLRKPRLIETHHGKSSAAWFQQPIPGLKYTG